MSDALKKLHDYLAKSPSVIYPEDVLAYLPAIEDENAKLRQELEVVGTAAYLYGRTDLADENAKLRELVRQMHPRAKAFLQMGVQLGCNDTLSYDWELQMHELGVEVGDD